jgi:hypothetical protein
LQKQQLELMSKSGELEKIPLFGADALRVMELSIKYRWEINLTSIVCCILCIVAALMMRKLKRSGYFIYVLAQVVSVALPAYFLGQNSIFSLVFSILFPLAFIIMYGANLKHLK